MVGGGWLARVVVKAGRERELSREVGFRPYSFRVADESWRYYRRVPEWDLDEPGRGVPARYDGKPFYVWRVFYKESDVPDEYVQEFDPKSGSFVPLPPEIERAVEEGVMFKDEASSTVDRRVFRAVSDHVDVVAPTAADAVRMARSSPEWKPDYRFVRVSEVVDNPPDVPGVVRAGFSSCLPVARTWFGDADARTVCAVAAYNFASFEAPRLSGPPGVYWGREVGRVHPFGDAPLWSPTVSDIRRLTGLDLPVQANSLSRLEREGLVRCERRGSVRDTCVFVGKPVGRAASPVTRGMLEVASVVFPRGRPSRLSDVQRDVLGSLIEHGVPESLISSRLGVSSRTIYRFKKASKSR